MIRLSHSKIIQSSQHRCFHVIQHIFYFVRRTIVRNKYFYRFKSKITCSYLLIRTPVSSFFPSFSLFGLTKQVQWACFGIFILIAKIYLLPNQNYPIHTLKQRCPTIITPMILWQTAYSIRSKNAWKIIFFSMFHSKNK